MPRIAGEQEPSYQRMNSSCRVSSSRNGESAVSPTTSSSTPGAVDSASTDALGLYLDFNTFAVDLALDAEGNPANSPPSHGLDDWLMPNPGGLDQAAASHDLGLGLGDNIIHPIADSGLWNLEQVNVPLPGEDWRVTTGQGPSTRNQVRGQLSALCRLRCS